MKKALFYGICTAILCLCHACQDPSRLEICNLRCEMLEAPLAIDNTSPHFSWEMRSKDNAMGISAYQILVATEPGRLNEKEADLWNSGKVACSGGIYAYVPNIWYGLPKIFLSVIRLFLSPHIPKSASTAVPSALNKTFSGFKSRCTFPFE